MSLNQKDVGRVIRIAATECGLSMAGLERHELEARVARLMLEARARTADELAWKLGAEMDSRSRLRLLASAVSHKTSWLFGTPTWEALKNRMLPDLLDQMIAGQREGARVLAAGVSTGQEAWSVAMLVDLLCDSERFKGARREAVQIEAVDLSPGAIFIASAGRYNVIDMRGVDETLQRRFFSKDQDVLEIKQRLRERVSFRHENLLDACDEERADCDIVMMRNVLADYTPPFREKLCGSAVARLAPGGVLALAPAERPTGDAGRLRPREGADGYYTRA